MDILGFASHMEKADTGGALSLSDLHAAARLLGSDEDISAVREWGPELCPAAPKMRDDVDFQLTQVSDCVVVSTEVSPAGAITIINHCWKAVFRLLSKGLMCRGHIRRGKIYHKERDFYGAGYQEAVRREKTVAAFKRAADDRGTPFVELDVSVRSYISSCGDNCVAEMYTRLVREDAEVAALFPFKRLSASLMLGGGTTYDATKEKANVDNTRAAVKRLKAGVYKHVNRDNPDALRKLEHYEYALNDQLRECNVVDEMINKLGMPFPHR
jgi:hypothetical protein